MTWGAGVRRAVLLIELDDGEQHAYEVPSPVQIDCHWSGGNLLHWTSHELAPPGAQVDVHIRGKLTSLRRIPPDPTERGAIQFTEHLMMFDDLQPKELPE